MLKRVGVERYGAEGRRTTAPGRHYISDKFLVGKTSYVTSWLPRDSIYHYTSHGCSYYTFEKTSPAVNVGVSSSSSNYFHSFENLAVREVDINCEMPGLPQARRATLPRESLDAFQVSKTLKLYHKMSTRVNMLEHLEMIEKE